MPLVNHPPRPGRSRVATAIGVCRRALLAERIPSVCKQRRWTLLVLALGSFAVLVPVGLAMATHPSRHLPPYPPATVKASSGGRSSGCVHKWSCCCYLRGPQGVAGKTGAAGPTGEAGRIGDTGSAGPAGPIASAGAPGREGVQGVPGQAGVGGLAGAAGPQGVIGVPGSDGIEGLRGVQGDTGATGVAGPAGPQGTAGSQGAQGTTGATGPGGLQGASGAGGALGPAGPTGPAGAAGPTGSNGLSEYAYVYNLGAQTVPLEADVIFDAHGVLTSGITHVAGSAGVVLVNAGTYQVTFSVSGTEVSQIAVFVNGVTVPGAIYGSGAGTQQNTGQTIVTVAAGAVLTIRNHTSSAAVGLATPIGGTQASTNASVVIGKLN
jgi:hypothetical protein